MQTLEKAESEASELRSTLQSALWSLAHEEVIAVEALLTNVELIAFSVSTQHKTPVALRAPSSFSSSHNTHTSTHTSITIAPISSSASASASQKLLALSESLSLSVSLRNEMDKLHTGLSLLSLSLQRLRDTLAAQHAQQESIFSCCTSFGGLWSSAQNERDRDVSAHSGIALTQIYPSPQNTGTSGSYTLRDAHSPSFAVAQQHRDRERRRESGGSLSFPQLFSFSREDNLYAPLNEGDRAESRY